MNAMKLLRRVLLTAALLLLTALMIGAAEKYNDLLYLFYPSFCREVLGYLATWAAKFDYVLWQRLCWVAAALIVVTLVITILRRDNFLHWFFGWTVVVALFLCIYTAAWGLNRQGPDISSDMRLETSSDYTSSQLQAAAEYYLDEATKAAREVTRDKDSLCQTADFPALANAAASGFTSMTKTCFVFGGSTEPAKPLEWSGLLRKFGVRGMMVPFTGEACVNTKLLPAATPFEISKQLARRMSIARDTDANFAAILACTASDDATYRYSGYFMAFSACYEALEKVNPSKAAELAGRISGGLRADLIANGSLDGNGSNYLSCRINTGKDASSGTVANLLVAWHVQLTTPVQEEEEASTTGAETVPPPEEATHPADLKPAA